VRDPGHAELAAEPGLGAVPSTCTEARRSPRNTWLGRAKEEGWRNRNAGLGETESQAEQVPQSAEEEENLLAPHMFGRGGAGPRKG